MFDDNQYIEQPNNAAQPNSSDGSTFTQEDPVQGPPATPATAPTGIDDPQAMDELAKNLEDLGAPSDNPATADPTIEDILNETSADPDPQPDAPPEPTPQEPTTNDAPATISPELADIKQRALMELSPLVDKLDQAPPEKFKTVMMLIQASDNQALVGAAYEAANGIEDETARARALLDVVNEINYFTSKTTGPET